MAGEIPTNLDSGHHRLEKEISVVPLQQPCAGNGVRTFDVDISAKKSLKTPISPSMAMATYIRGRWGNPETPSKVTTASP